MAKLTDETMSRALTDQIAVVTGGASGIGRAIATAMAQAGATVVIADLSEKGRHVAASLGDKHEAHVVDVTCAQQVRELMDGTVSRHGRIDILVNCAGILTEVPLVEMSLETWDKMIEVDLRSVFLACRYTTPHMVADGRVRINNIASQLALKGGESLVHYSAAKAGVVGLTKALARELAPMGVLVNAIAPGPIETPLVDAISADWKETKQAELPLGRFGRPEEVAPTALLLASDPGGNLYVGQVLGPNSGDVMP